MFRVLDANGAQLTNGPLAGSGTINVHAKWVTATTLGNSSLVDNGSTVTMTPTSTVVNTGHLISASLNDFLQYDLQNTSFATSAQSTYSLTADNGTPTTGFMSININNSTFTAVNAYSIGVANDTSVLGSGQDMYVANAHNAKDIIFSLGKAASPYFDEFGRFSRSNSQFRVSATNGVLAIVAATQDGVAIRGRAGGTTSLIATITPAAALTGSFNYLLPVLAANDTFAMLGKSQSFTVAQSITDTTNAASPITGAFKIGNGTAATSVGIGNGNINAGGTLTVGSLTAGRITFAGAAGLLQDSVGLVRETTSITHGLSIGDGSGNCGIILNGPAAGNRDITWATNTLGVSTGWRWTARAIGAEGGSNAGSDWTLSARTDTGALIDAPINIVRAAGGAIALARPVTVSYGSAQLAVGNGSGAPRILIDGATANQRLLNFRSAGSTRWQLGADATAEAGSDAGSLFVLSAYTDAAGLIDNPISIFRAAGGQMTLARPVAITGVLNQTITDAVTNAVSDVGFINHRSSGTPTAGFGPRLSWRAQSSTTVDMRQAYIESSWVDATHATRTSSLKLQCADFNANRLVIEIQSDGSAGRLGFFGATPVIRPSMAAWTGTATRTTFATSTATLANVAEALKALIDDFRAYGLEA